MDRLEKIQQIKEEVRSKVLVNVKKTRLDYEADDGTVRRQIEAALDAVVQPRWKGP